MTLSELIATMPDEATATDAEVLAWLVEDVDTWQDIPWLDLTVWTHTSGITRSTLTTAAGGTGATATAAQHVLDCIVAGQPLSASDQRVRDLIAASSLSSAQKNALTALATVQVPRWNFGAIDEYSKLAHIAEARNG